MALISYPKFKANTYGKQIDLDHFPKAQPFQCVDLANLYCLQVVGSPVFHGNAKDLFGQHPDKYIWVRNTTSGVPPQGAVFIYGSTWGGGFGHIGIVDHADKAHVTLLEQNVGTPRVTIGTHLYAGAIGWGIPKNKVAPAPAPTSKPGRWQAVRVSNIRVAPHVNSPLGGTRTLHVGEWFDASGTVQGDVVAGNGVWVRSLRGNYVWSGNLKKIG